MPAIAVVGDRDLGFVTHRELDAELARMPAGVEAAWLPSPRAAEAAGADALWIAPGTPYADDDAVLAAIGRAIDDGTPLLGTCGGFQYAVLALARRAGLDAAHAETEPGAGARPARRPAAGRASGGRRGGRAARRPRRPRRAHGRR